MQHLRDNINSNYTQFDYEERKSHMRISEDNDEETIITTRHQRKTTSIAQCCGKQMHSWTLWYFNQNLNSSQFLFENSEAACFNLNKYQACTKHCIEHEWQAKDDWYINLWSPKIDWEVGLAQHTESLNSLFKIAESARGITQTSKIDLEFTSPPQNLTKSGNLKKKAGRKRLNTELTKRKDVILKSILRKIRNFVKKDFVNRSNYFKTKIDTRIENMKELLSDYITNVMNKQSSASIVETLAIFILADDYELYLNSQNSDPNILISK